MSDDFSIDQTIIDVELCKLPATMARYAQEEARLKTLVESTEANLEKTYADLDEFIRISRKDEKLTESKVKQYIVQHDNYQKINNDLIQFKFDYNVARHHLNILNAKKDCLIAISYRDRQLVRADRYQ